MLGGRKHAMAHLRVALPLTCQSDKPHRCEEGGCQVHWCCHGNIRRLLSLLCKAPLRRTLTLYASASALAFAAHVA